MLRLVGLSAMFLYGAICAANPVEWCQTTSYFLLSAFILLALSILFVAQFAKDYNCTRQK